MLIVSVAEDKAMPEETDEAACGYKSLFATCRGWEVVVDGGNTIVILESWRYLLQKRFYKLKDMTFDACIVIYSHINVRQTK